VVSESVSVVRPFIVSAAIRGVSLQSDALKQIMQLQEKLHNTYGAKRKKASIGVYDLDKISPPLTYIALPPDEIAFIPLECSSPMSGREILETTSKGKEYGGIISGSPLYPLLVDSEGTVLSMPPIINSEDTRVSESSTNILIDVTGLDHKSINTCLNIMTTSALERGGLLQSVEIRYPKESKTTPELKETIEKVSLSTVRSVSGMEFTQEELRILLKRMGHKPEVLGKDLLSVNVPPYRVDVIHEYDLIEDIIISYGLNKIGSEQPKVLTFGKRAEGSRLKSRVRDLMIGMGFLEVATYLLSNYDVMVKRSLLPDRPLVRIANPVSSEYTVMRDVLIPKLLQFLSSNTHVDYPQKIFEYGALVQLNNGVPRTVQHLGALVSDDHVSFEEIQAVAYSLFKNLSKNVKFERMSSNIFIEGRAAKIKLEELEVGILGEVNPQVLLNFGLTNPVAAMEVDVSRLKCLESLFRG
ncbi:MAG: phenylalanine--tRNA ligase subunit beta, partial [Candidatus Verstraetearchaeota archaeon]|nr:phenylalanine--tRNA ligase subunit beta [Candidatus Verstraetearchaeota archaeon]